VVGNYVLDYDVDDQGVAIIAIRHGRQNVISAAVEADFDYEAPGDG
jgi:plasmid stabilization system protein ParE